MSHMSRAQSSSSSSSDFAVELQKTEREKNENEDDEERPSPSDPAFWSDDIDELIADARRWHDGTGNANLLDDDGVETVTNFIRSLKEGHGHVISVLRQHLRPSGQSPSREPATADELVEALTEYATEYKAFKVRLFNGYVKKVKQARVRRAAQVAEKQRVAEAIVVEQRPPASPEDARAGWAAIKAATEGVVEAVSKPRRTRKPAPEERPEA